MQLTQPRAITMWDFSWLERRWPGAGYEDIDHALDELVERGYDAVRIDAYPHLILADPEAEFELIPVWGVNDWGSPMRCKVRRVLPELLQFIRACGQRGISVGLSTWCRRDTTEAWRQLFSPERHAAAWIAVLDGIRDAGLIEHIFYVDLCNEWPMQIWAPYFYGQDIDAAAASDYSPNTWFDERSLSWLRRATAVVRAAYPQLSVMTSIHPWGNDPAKIADSCDFFEPHLWMANGDFYQRLGWTFNHKWDNQEFEQVAKFAEPLYRGDEAHWLGHLKTIIEDAATTARRLQKPLITTECWGIVDYKDAPLMDWDWVKESCAAGTRFAADTACWAAIATSNFCGPQFVGMWRDIEWHRELTDYIKAQPLPSWSSKLTGIP